MDIVLDKITRNRSLTSEGKMKEIKEALAYYKQYNHLTPNDKTALAALKTIEWIESGVEEKIEPYSLFRAVKAKFREFMNK